MEAILSICLLVINFIATTTSGARVSIFIEKAVGLPVETDPIFLIPFNRKPDAFVNTGAFSGSNYLGFDIALRTPTIDNRVAPIWNFQGDNLFRRNDLTKIHFEVNDQDGFYSQELIGETNVIILDDLECGVPNALQLTLGRLDKVNNFLSAPFTGTLFVTITPTECD